MSKRTTIAQYLIDSLQKAGISDIFGIPGDYIVNFFGKMEKSRLKIIGTCSEQGAAFAADAYARLNGIGALCVTYCVGGLNTINAVAGAYAEKAPLIVISGAPGVCERNAGFMLHHSIKDLDSQIKIFQEVTVAVTRLDNPQIAAYEIDRVIKACLKHKRPVYIELPRDMLDVECELPPPIRELMCKSCDTNAFDEALNEAVEMIKKAENPLIIGGVEIRRYGLKEEFKKLLAETGFPYVTTILGKSIIDEAHPQFLGIYMGKIGNRRVQDYFAKNDCTIILGELMADTTLGTAQLDISKTIFATDGQLRIKYHSYGNIELQDFIKALTERLKNDNPRIVFNSGWASDYVAQKGEPLLISRFYDRLNSFIPEDEAVIVDVGDCLFGSADLRIPRESAYLGPAYYTSMGYAIPACLGVLAKYPNARPIVLVGDGAFQMTGHEISNFVRLGLKPIILVLNNHGYTTQRYLRDGAFNEIHNWEYHRIPELLGAGLGLEVLTEDELDVALERARANTESFTILNLHFDKYDKSDTLGRLTTVLGKNVRLKSSN